VTELLIKNILIQELFGTMVCESADHQYVVDFLYEDLMLEKLLFGEPITVPELRKLLHKRIVNFEFIKLSGEIRNARGTTMMKYIPTSQHPTGNNPSSKKVATFYDLRKKDWRSVSKKSKEIVLKQDPDTKKPVVQVRDRSKVEVKPITKDTRLQIGKTYQYTTNKGTDTYVEVIKDLGRGLWQVKSPRFKTVFAISSDRIGKEMPPSKAKPEISPKVQSPEVQIQPDVKATAQEKTKSFHFRNKTGGNIDSQITGKEAIQKLKDLGPGWFLIDDKQYDDEQFKKEKNKIETDKIVQGLKPPPQPEEDEEILDEDIENLDASEI